jgi:DNA helicase IV
MKNTQLEINQKIKENDDNKILLNNHRKQKVDINNVIKDCQETIESIKKLITNKYNDINTIKNTSNYGIIYQLVEILSLGFIDYKKTNELEILKINRDINTFNLNIDELNVKIDHNHNLFNTITSRITNIIERIDNKSFEIKKLENAFNNKLNDFKNKLVEIEQELIVTSKYKYIDVYTKQNFVFFINKTIGSNEEFVTHKKIKSFISELINFKKDSNEWVKKKNILFIKNEKLHKKAFFSNVESQPLTDKQTEAVLTNEVSNLILAGAGSGKTSVIVAKVLYLIEKKLIMPQHILILTFNKKAQEELKARFLKKNIADIDIKTFHSFGLGVIGKVSSKKPDICVMSESSNNMNIFIENTIKDLIENNNLFLKIFLEFNAYFKIPYKDESEFDNLGEYYEYQKNYDMKTLKQQLLDKEYNQSGEKITLNRETVKSYQELIIANYFTLNRIEYRYEYPYKYDTATQNYRQYKPDFYLPEYDIYIEHFGIDRNNKTAPYVNNKEYLDGIKWKIELHRTNATNLIQTFSYEFSENHLLDSLQKKLLKYNVIFRELEKNEIIKLLTPTLEDKSFTKLFTTFLNHFKSNRLNILTLKRIARDDKRTILFVEIFEFIFDKYNEYQQENKCIDFDDMIIRALEYIENNSFKSNYKHIFIDEFQDISTTRANLIKSLVSQNKSHLTVVGDDWQSINRFAGSNIEIIQKFNEIYGNSETVSLDYSFRFDNQISEIASKFIQKNPHQLVKEIKTLKIQKHNKFSICVLWSSNEKEKLVQTRNDLIDILRLIIKKEGSTTKTVKILDRYNFNLKGLNNITNLFNTLEISFTSVHSSKGLEADYIIVLNVNNGKFGFPSMIEDDPILNIVVPESDDFNNSEERRLFYVALTRTKGTLFLLGDMYQKSIFLEEIIKENENFIYFLNDPKIKLINCLECKIGVLKKRTSSNGNNNDKYFYGCSNFPRCKYTEKVNYCPKCNSEMYKDIEKKIAMCKNNDCEFESLLCEDCNDYMIERTGQYGKFLGCSAYPKCKFTI